MVRLERKIATNYMHRSGTEKLCTPYPVPQYLRNHVPRILKTMYYVPQARKYVPSTLDTMYFYQRFDKKSGIIPIMFENYLCFQYNTT